MSKKYLEETLVTEVVKQHGYPEEEDETVEGVGNVRVESPVGDTGAKSYKTEIVRYKAKAKLLSEDRGYTWEIEEIKPL